MILDADWVRQLWELPRSLTGQPNRDALAVLKNVIPELSARSVPSGTRLWDWTVPPEWNVSEAFIETPDSRVGVWSEHPLHVVQHSMPVDTYMATSTAPIHTLPGTVPYRTAYYDRTWGFCLSDETRDELPEAARFVIDADLNERGQLDWSEAVYPGKSRDEILFSTYLCHPRQANDNLSGVVTAARLAAYVAGLASRRWTYRFLFIPETIGTLAALAAGDWWRRVVAGWVVTCCGDRGALQYKESVSGDALPDWVTAVVASEFDIRWRPFSPIGSDERQFGSPGFRMPVGSLTRTPYHAYPEYHTAGDDLSVIDNGAMDETLAAYCRLVDVVEESRRFRRTDDGYGEPQLGRRGLYPTTGGDSHRHVAAIMGWLMWPDRPVQWIADRCGVEPAVAESALDRLVSGGLLTEVAP